MVQKKVQSTINVDDDGVLIFPKLPGFFPGPNLYDHKKSSHIVEHWEHSFDKDHNVIVIKGKSENRQELINSYEEITGVQNIMKLIEKSGDWSLANKADTITGDVAEFTGNPIEVEEKIVKAQLEASESLAQFNNKFGTNFTRDEFLKLVDSGEFAKVIQELAKKGENINENSNS